MVVPDPERRLSYMYIPKHGCLVDANVAGVYDADGLRPVGLDGMDGSPENSLAAASSSTTQENSQR